MSFLSNLWDDLNVTGAWLADPTHKAAAREYAHEVARDSGAGANDEAAIEAISERAAAKGSPTTREESRGIAGLFGLDQTEDLDRLVHEKDVYEQKREEGSLGALLKKFGLTIALVGGGLAVLYVVLKARS